jgi:head-tail adaptor
VTAALPASLLIHTVSWIVPTTSTDAYGNTVKTWGSGTSISGRVEQNKADEPREDGRDAAEREWTLFTNQDGISAKDRIVFGSLTFEVEGPPAPTYGATGFHHAEVHLRLVEG